MAIPFPIAIVVCDQVYEDLMSRRKTILGTISRFVVDEFPATLPPFSVFVAMSFEGSGRSLINFQIVDDDDDEIEGSRQSVGVEFIGLSATDVVLKVPEIVVKSPGPIWVQIFSGNRLVVECRITIDRSTGQGST